MPRTPAAAPKARGRQKAATPGTDEKREGILRVAERLFHAQGYADTTMAQIVAELGVSKPYVYYYFHDKQELFELLSWRPAAECFGVFDPVAGDTRPSHQQVTEGLAQMIRLTVSHYPAAFFAYREPHAFRPQMRAAQKRLANRFRARLCALLDAGRREGRLQFNDTQLTALAVCSLPGFMFSWYRPDGRLDPEAMVAELSTLAFRLVGLRTTLRTNRG